MQGLLSNCVLANNQSEEDELMDWGDIQKKSMAAFATKSELGAIARGEQWTGALDDADDFGILQPDVADLLDSLRNKRRRRDDGEDNDGAASSKVSEDGKDDTKKWLDDVTINKAERDWAKAANTLEGQLNKCRKSMQDCITDFQSSPVRADEFKTELAIVQRRLQALEKVLRCSTDAQIEAFVSWSMEVAWHDAAVLTV
eukprot:14749335-Alexandrium_andersonii.AAC.1